MYPIDELANIVAMANEQEQQALTKQIEENGQIDAAVLWRGKLVDGRCRQLACIALGKELKVRELDDNLSREEVAKIVKSLNIRRNLTPTQKAMSAYKEQVDTGWSNEKTADSWGIPLGSYKNAKYLATNAPEYVEDLFNGKTVTIFDPDKGYTITTDKINTLARIIKKKKEADLITIDNSEEIKFEWTVDGVLKTEAAKEWYYSTVSTLDVKDVTIKMLLVELANLKFRIQDGD